jgi:chromosome segregation ATPase
MTEATLGSPEAQANGQKQQPMQSIHLKRGVTVKTVVTELFKQQAHGDLGQELKVIDEQMESLEAQYQNALRQLEAMAQKGQDVRQQLNELNNEAQQKRGQLSSLKMEVSSQLANLDKLPEGAHIVTGNLENFVQVRVGENLYDKVRNAEIIVRDGIVVAIQG